MNCLYGRFRYALEIGCKVVRVNLQTTADSMPMHNANPNDCDHAMLLQVGALHADQCRRASCKSKSHPLAWGPCTI